jgi:hypothetical protein
MEEELSPYPSLFLSLSLAISSPLFAEIPPERINVIVRTNRAIVLLK